MTTERVILMLILIFSTGQSVLGRTGTMDDWIRLTSTLFSNYTKEIYPVYNLSETLTIDTSMFLLSILDFDEVSGVITLNGGLILTWVDYRLTWNPSDYGGIRDALLNSSVIWKPKLFLLTTAEDMEPYILDQFDVRVYHNGTCEIPPGRRMKVVCSVDMLRFPLDSHICDLLLMQWGVSHDETVLVNTRTEIITDYYTPNGEWDVAQTSVSDSTLLRDTLSFTIHITRKPAYFTLSLIIPILLLCFLNPFVFLLPASSGERMSYIITMFLSLAVYMSMIGDNMPNVSENMAAMSSFLLITLVYSGTLIVLTIVTLRCEALSHVNKFPRFLRRLTLCFHKQRKNRVVDVKGLDVEKEENEKNKRQSDIDNDIQKDDVMRLINMSLFVTSLSVLLIGTSWFFYHLFK